MTEQRDPDRPLRRPKNLNRERKGWDFLPILLGLIIIVAIGYILLAPAQRETTADRGTQTSSAPVANNPTTNSPSANPTGTTKQP
jgi:hypothetical protein